MSVLILTYHAIEDGPPPLCVAPATFGAHLDAIAGSGAEVLTLASLAERIAQRELPERAVAITFDDGLRSVVREAAPMLGARGMPATVFAVAGHLGGQSDWPTQPPKAPRRPLASSDELIGLADRGWEIGCHGFDHAPLTGATGAELERELVTARERLEAAVGRPVTSLAYPYGALPGLEGRALVEREYAAACTTELGAVEEGADLHALPRVEVHYVRRPDLLSRAIEGKLSSYLTARRLGSRARRMVRPDYSPPGPRRLAARARRMVRRDHPPPGLPGTSPRPDDSPRPRVGRRR